MLPKEQSELKSSKLKGQYKKNIFCSFPLLLLMFLELGIKAIAHSTLI